MSFTHLALYYGRTSDDWLAKKTFVLKVVNYLANYFKTRNHFQTGVTYKQWMMLEKVLFLSLDVMYNK
jgi:hypothetical protein